jgi:hypothetical protein
MPSDGLLLVGCLDELSAVNYLKQRCWYRTTPTDSFLKRQWRESKEKIGERAPWVGEPTFAEIQKEHNEHLEKVKRTSWFQEVLEGMPHEFRMVEIAPLLAFQVDVDLDRAKNICQGLPENPSIQEMLGICLPYQSEKLELRDRLTADGGVVVETNNKNFIPRLGEYWGVDPKDGLHLAGFKFGTTNPLTQVVKLGDLYYLKNGYHRAIGLARLKATHMPCIFLRASRFEQVGAVPGKTIPASTLYSSNPPTCGHFFKGLAYEMPLRTWVPAYEVRLTNCGYWKD